MTHHLSYVEKKIFHWLQKVETNIEFHEDGSASIVLSGKVYKFPKYLVKKWKIESKDWKRSIDVSIGIYEIDLINQIQTNLFTGYQRRLGYKIF